MIDILIILTLAVIVAALIASYIMTYFLGVRRGVDIIARVELAEWEAGVVPIPDEYKEYVKIRRETVRTQDKEKVYQLWRKAQGLPDGATARELFNDPQFREQLEAQKHVS